MYRLVGVQAVVSNSGEVTVTLTVVWAREGEEDVLTTDAAVGNDIPQAVASAIGRIAQGAGWPMVKMAVRSVRAERRYDADGFEAELALSHGCWLGTGRGEGPSIVQATAAAVVMAFNARLAYFVRSGESQEFPVSS